MTYVVTDPCIRCKFMECVEVCPVGCFAAGEVMLVINPELCIDCGLCDPLCPTQAIVHESDPRCADWLAINRERSGTWPSVTIKGDPCAGAELWRDRPGKSAQFNSRPAVQS